MSRRYDELKVTHQLPSPTGVALAILRLAESDQTTMAEISRVVQSDPALCGRLLKIANSASMGRGRPSTSVGEVVTQLGIRMVRSIALGFSLVSQHGRGACQAFDYTRFWSHSLAMGIAVQAGSRRTGGIAPHEAFTAGLLAQVGRLALACIYPDAYSEILTRVQQGSLTDLRELELAHFAMDHHELTGALLRDWGMPEECVLAVERFDNSSAASLEAGDRTLLLTRLLQLGARMADVCLADEGEHARLMLALLLVGRNSASNRPSCSPSAIASYTTGANGALFSRSIPTRCFLLPSCWNAPVRPRRRRSHMTMTWKRPPSTAR